MIKLCPTKILSKTHWIVLTAILSALSSSVFAAAENVASISASPWLWDLVIASIVFSATLASAVLCVSAFRNWPQKGWRWGALLPIAILLLILVAIAIAKLGDGDSHELWPLEIFAWAMMNMIYMVGLMTTKRIFEKADAANTAKPQP